LSLVRPNPGFVAYLVYVSDRHDQTTEGGLADEKWSLNLFYMIVA